MVFARRVDGGPPEPDRERVLSTATILQGGRTTLNLPAVLKGFDPQPDPPASRPELGTTKKQP